MSILVEIQVNIAEEVQQVQRLLKGIHTDALGKALLHEVQGHLLVIRDYTALAVDELDPD